LLTGGEPGFAWPDFSALGVTAHKSFGTGPLYRGRFRQLSLVVLADQTSDDDTFAARALTGEAGQYVQGFLRAAGLTERYLIMRTLPVDTLDLDAAKRLALADDPRVANLHRELLRRLREKNPEVAVVLAMGAGARRLAPRVVPAGVEVIGLDSFGEPGYTTSWRAALNRLSGLVYAKDLATATFTLPTGRGQLPRKDLPYGTPRWVGTSGDRAVRPIDTDTGRPSPDYLKLFLPAWVAGLDPAPLTPEELAAVERLRQ
jgi:hypothetical protein